MDMDGLRARLEGGADEYIKVGVVDMDGIVRGKYMSGSKFLSALEGGFAFCDVVLGWDSNDKLYDNVSYTGWHTGYPDAAVRVIEESGRLLPFENDQPFFLCEFTGAAEALCPRGVLRRVLADAASLGYSVKAGIEYEFFVFEETPESAREKGFRNLKHLAPGTFGYSVLRSSEHAPFYQAILDACTGLDIPLEGLHEETGPGVLEAAIAVDDCLAAADKAALFRTFTKVVARQHGKMATFMAKCTQEWPGQSGHMHLSLWKDGASAFYDEKGEHRMSEEMRYFLGGQQALMPEVLAMISPTINSFTRLIPGAWAPTAATWGVENRTCALRVIPGSSKSQRIEYRISAADANPYLALAAAIASGLWGIRNKIEPGTEIRGNAYDVQMPDSYSLPTTLWDAAQRLRASTAAREAFGDAFVEHFAATREWEEREFRKHVTDWELKRYFEII
ncbi:glutamine synthetase family protein [Kordiimonas pumila]|uniref:Glutamine synthetase family protein n=1 Tax=Kordiimonas pumila TaxID=2161677 RepID=A0ABV7D9G6_9PROT|nr:glutamine synthetase [Kordiimonas pumila]